jgi:hypothetical protein
VSRTSLLILCDVELGLCICESVVVSHPPRSEMIVWGSMMCFEQWLEWWRWLISSWHVVLESTTCVITCPVWNGLPTNYECYRLCVLLRWVGMSIILCVIHVTYFVKYFVTYIVICLNHMVQEATFVWETLALQVGLFVQETVAKHDSDM